MIDWLNYVNPLVFYTSPLSHYNNGSQVSTCSLYFLLANDPFEIPILVKHGFFKF